jgi:exodeoxyribonuclease VII small subunit
VQACRPPFAGIEAAVSEKTSADQPVALQGAEFEAALAELEGIVEALEHGDLSLDESLRRFERGVQLTRACQSALKNAEQKVEILLRKTGAPGEFETAAFDPTSD